MRFAFLNLEDHPRGNHILGRLLDAGHVPVAVVEERSALAEANRDRVRKDLDGHQEFERLCPSREDVLRNQNVPVLTVSNHNDTRCREILDQLGLDLVVLGDARILRRPAFSIPRLGSINIHPGLLPTVRGNTPYIWAAYYGLPQGCTAHFIDDDIDTGPLICTREVLLDGVRSYSGLLAKIHVECGSVALEALKLIGSGQFRARPQEDLNPRRYGTFQLAPPDVKKHVIDMLATKTGAQG